MRLIIQLNKPIMTHLFLANFTVRKHNGNDGWFENQTLRLVYADNEQQARQKVIEKYDFPDTYIYDLEITQPIN